MKTLQELQEDGIDVDGAMERFMDNEKMFRDFLRELPEEKTCHFMIQALEERNVEKAFDWAHRLKGIIANLSLSSLYNSIYDIVEILGDGNFPDIKQTQCFIQLYEDTMEYIRKEV